MINLFLTKKFSSELKITSGNAIPTECNSKYNWLGQVFLLNRHKYYLFINEESLFSVVLDKKTTANPFEDLKTRVGYWAKKLYIQENDISEYLSHFDHINVLSARDKRFLGTLKGIVYFAKKGISDIADQTEMIMDLVEIKINDVPHSKLKHCPTCSFQEMLGNGTPIPPEPEIPNNTSIPF